MVGEHLLRHRAALEIDDPALQARRALVGHQRARIEHPRVPHDVQHDAGPIVIRPQRVEDEARIDLKPPHVRIGALARHDADAGGILRIPGVGKVAVDQRDSVQDGLGYADPADDPPEEDLDPGPEESWGARRDDRRVKDTGKS